MLLNTQENLPVVFTQGDDTVLLLLATNDQGVPVDLPGASLSTQILGPNGAGQDVFPNSQHTVDPDQVANRGKFSLALSSTDTGNCGLGQHKQIITEALISGATTYFQGPNLLAVYADVPLQ